MKFLLTITLSLIPTCLTIPVALAATVLVGNQAEFSQALGNLAPGDTLALKKGEWRDFEILFTGEGTAEKPIRLVAEENGKVLLTGRSNLRLAGNHLVVSGLVFKDGHSPTNTVISFRRTKGEPANHSRVTQTVIDNFNNPERHETDFWVMLYGKHNRFDHNHLEGKRNRGVTLAVRLDTETGRENHHRIDHNYFGPRPVLGSNGGETLRIGTSHHSMSNSFTRVEHNYFDRCDGELEIISNKSGGNIFRGNLFRESRGTLTLRHGNNNLVEDNLFLGNGVDHTGGIRVINKRQRVRNNYLQGLAGYRFGGALVVMNGVPASPLNRYHRVEDSVIENNTIISARRIELAAGSDSERSATPKNTRFHHNLVFDDGGAEDMIVVHDDVSGILFRDNLTNIAVPAAIRHGFTQQAIRMEIADNGLRYPVAPAQAGYGVKPGLEMLRKSDTGVPWYPKPGAGTAFDSGSVIKVPAKEGALFTAAGKASAGDILALSEGVHSVHRTLIVTVPLTVRSARENADVLLEYDRNALFEIAEGGSLKLHGIRITGRSSPDNPGNTVIRTRRQSMLNNYRLVIENSRIHDLDVNHSFNVLSAAPHTFADSIVIANSSFEKITGQVLPLNREIEDLGIYGVEYIRIENTVFRDIDGAIADIYRGGTDESTFGPHVDIRSSTFESVGAGKRNRAGASIHLHGVQVANIEDNTFRASKPVKVIETVGEPKTLLRGNRFDKTDNPIVTGAL